jgi:predicted MFS family arabinose efflux permease
MQLFLLFFVGVFSGRALDAGLYKNTLIAGITCQIIAVFATSFCTKYYQLFLAQGLLQGLGNGLLYCPAVALVSTYFPLRRRALALSVVASGGATGGMVFPAIARSLLDKIGFAWTIRVMGFVMLVVHGIVLPFSKTRPTSVRAKKDRAWLDPTAARDAPYLLFCIGIFLGFWGLFFAYFYVGSYGRDILGVSQGTSFTLLLVINCIGIPGRVVPNYLADRYFGSLNIEILFIFITGVLLMTWFAVHSITAFYAWVAVYGFFGGGCQSLFQSACSSFSTDPDKIGIRIGMVCTVVSFACLSGSPIAGRLLEAKEGRYLGAQIFGGVVMIIGSMFLLAARLAQCGRTTES